MNELNARQSYLYDLLHVYFLPGTPEGNYTPLTPMGDKGPDILFITGHTPSVKAYLDCYISKIPEKQIVITSCFGNEFKKYAKRKEIYVPKRTGYCYMRNGSPYGFNFVISDAELDLYNSNGTIAERICNAYTKL